MKRCCLSLHCLCLFFILAVEQGNAQHYSTSDWEEIIQQLDNTEENQSRLEGYMEDLKELSLHPLNINQVTKEQLEQLPFLSADQIENILYYLYVVGAMKTLYELQLVQDMDRLTIQYLLPFIYLGEPLKAKGNIPLSRMLKYGRNEFLSRTDLPFYTKEGYLSTFDEASKTTKEPTYLGSKFYNSLKYSFHYKTKLQFGFVAEKDPGEPLFCGKNKTGYDAYSLYFLLQNRGKIKALAIGDYRLNYGMGLVLNTNFSMGKTSSLATLGYKTATIRKHSSTSESRFFRGIALSYQLTKPLNFSLFYSHRYIDATVNNSLITSIKSDGLHRTKNDFDKRNRAVSQTVGSNLSYHSTCFNIGLTIVHNYLNKLLKQKENNYSIHQITGKRWTNCSVDYRYRFKHLTFYGETALAQNGALATINALRFKPVAGYQVLCMQRYYSPSYFSWYSNAVSEGGSVNNESGYFIGISGTPLSFLSFSTYADFFYFPWLKYGVNKPSAGFEGVMQLVFTTKKNLSLLVRYMYEDKEKNRVEEEQSSYPIRTRIKHKMKVQVGYTLNNQLSLRTTCSTTAVGFSKEKKSTGLLLFQTVAYHLKKLALHIDVNYGFFDTDNYLSSIRMYEKSALYTLSIPSFSGKGVRSSAVIRWDFHSSFMLLAKIGQTNYSDRDFIGVGNEKIRNHKKTDLSLQFRIKF
ncbi:MAG: helix-hairpin-helix domain-containing protein [Bacteroidaceae bacterium]|nr:helix-hairpin-helix domain-containing protein [Bacteroidaceae bacterium]